MKKVPVEPSAARSYAICFVLFLGTLLLFSRAVGHEFLDCDDPDYVIQNIHVQSGLTWAGVRWAFMTDLAGNWHPFTWLSHMLDWQLFGNNPHAHHATNVFWHALNAVLAFLVFRRLTGAFWTSASSAALFAWHPLRVESVAWVAERKDVLSVFFGLLTLWTYAVYVEKRRTSGGEAKYYYALTLAAFAAGLMCKPMLVTLPFLLLLLDWWPLRRVAIIRLRFEKLPFFLISGISCVLTYLAQRKGGAFAETSTFAVRLENAVVSVAGYLGKFFWPFNLAIGYPRPAHWPIVIVAGAAFLLLIVTGVAFWQRLQRPWLLVGWFWFLGLLVPVLGIVQVGLQAMADRYTYLPILGVQLALLWTLRELTFSAHMRWIGTAAVVLILAGCGARTWNQLGVWQNSATLYEHTLAVTKDNYLAHCYLGTTLFTEGHFDEAERHFQHAVELKPDYLTARRRLGLTLEKLGREDASLVAYEELLKLRPNDADAQFHCANVLARLNRDEEALPHYERAIQLNPDFAQAQCNYGDSLRALKRLDEACVHYRLALASQPDNANAYFGLGVALEDLGRTNEALASYNKAVESKPRFADAQYNIGALLLDRNQPAEAAAHFRATIESQSNYVAAYVGLGLAEKQLNGTTEAGRDGSK